MKTTTTVLAFLTPTLFYNSAAQAESFGRGSNTFDIEFVTVGT